MSWLKGKFIAYLFFGVAIIVLGLGTLEIVPMETAVIIAGLIGFPGGVVALRAYINSLGYKSYLTAGLMVVASLLILLKIVPYEMGVKILGFLASITGITLTQATAKT